MCVCVCKSVVSVFVRFLKIPMNIPNLGEVTLPWPIQL